MSSYPNRFASFDTAELGQMNEGLHARKLQLMSLNQSGAIQNDIAKCEQMIREIAREMDDRSDFLVENGLTG